MSTFYWQVEFGEHSKSPFTFEPGWLQSCAVSGEAEKVNQSLRTERTKSGPDMTGLAVVAATWTIIRYIFTFTNQICIYDCSINKLYTFTESVAMVVKNLIICVKMAEKMHITKPGQKQTIKARIILSMIKIVYRINVLLPVISTILLGSNSFILLNVWWTSEEWNVKCCRGNLYFEYETLKRSGVLWPCLDPMYKYCFYIFGYHLFVWGNECLKLLLV